jgi:hypothetical protein
MDDMLTTEYDGCGRCLVAVRRLSRKTDKTSGPQRQGDQDLQAAADAGGHIIAWACDWEVSGATDSMTRKGWVRGCGRDGPVRRDRGPHRGPGGPQRPRHAEHADAADRPGPGRWSRPITRGCGISATRIRKTSGWPRRGDRGWSCARSKSATGTRRSGRGMRANPSSAPRTGTCTCGWSRWGRSITWRSMKWARRSSARWPGGSWPTRRERSRSGQRRCA